MKHRGWMRFACGLTACGIALVFTSATSLAQEHPLTEADIWQMIIKESIQSYPRSCPCPYSPDASGHRCGNQSAHSRGGRSSPMCYPQDIPEEQLARYRELFQ